MIPDATNSEPIVALNSVTKRFGAHAALRDFDGCIRAGRLTGLVGPDGAGKTTLIRMVAGLMAPSSGKIEVCGLDTVRASNKLADLVGYMPQRFGLYEDLSVMENLNLYADLRGVARNHKAEVFAQLLDFTQLAPFTGRLAGKLSGGMKQKLGLACALMARPKLLLLDEPGVGVDPVSRLDLWRMVNALTDGGMAVVWATAYLDEAERCKEVLLLNQGQLAYQGDPAQLTARLAGRSFRLLKPSRDRRELLTEALDLATVCDGVIQGSSVRVVLKAGAAKDELAALASRAQSQLTPVSPRFEDAFVDLLGGGPGGTSAIASRMNQVELASDVVVSCSALTKRFGAFTATDTVSFDVHKGEIFGLLGPNGAGKSTTFKMLCGLMRPTAGRAEVTGFDLRTATSQAKLKLGYMAQKFSLYGLLSVKQNLDFSAGVYGLSAATKRDRVAEMIEVFQLTPYLDQAPDHIPLGFKQRLALACALMHRPAVLFLDEPTSGVDPITRREFWTHINGLVHKGVTILVTTHFMDEAEYCDRVALMYRSKLIALDTPDALKAQVKVADENTGEVTMEDAFIHLIRRENEQQAHLELAS